MGWLKNMIRNWLDIRPAEELHLQIDESLTFRGEAVKNAIWYRGDAGELEQLYKQLSRTDASATRFWAAVPPNTDMRKLHSGLPAMLVDTLAYIVKADMNEPDFACCEARARWEELSGAGGVDLPELVGDAVTGALVSGDGAFKITIDTDVSPYPMIEFVPGDRVEFVRQHGRIVETRFETVYAAEKERYRLIERYRPGSVSYELYDGKGHEVPLDRVPELAALKPVRFDGDFSLAVPFRVYKNPKFPGRGRSIYETKTDVFDAHDECISQWMDALRAGRVQKYIPEDMIPRDPDTGALLPVDSFGSKFIRIERSMTEGAVSQIDTIQPDIRYEAFLSTYTATLNMCLQGIMSPATLGIDVAKISSGEAQREKKDVTGHTRNTITAALEKTLPEVIASLLMAEDSLNGHAPGSYDVLVGFGEYSAPDFGARVETISKASTAGIMSVEAQVEELWGASKDEEWIESEIARIRQEKGIEEAKPPAAGDELNAFMA